MRYLYLILCLLIVVPCYADVDEFEGCASCDTVEGVTTSDTREGQTVASGAAACTTMADTYMFAYDGDYTADTDKACFTNGTATKDGTVQAATVSADYVTYSAVDQYIRWVISGDDGATDTQGTIYWTFFVDDDGGGDLDNNSLWELYSDGINRIICRTRDSGDYVRCVHTGDSTPITVNGDATGYDAWWRCGFTWKTGVGGGADVICEAGEDAVAGSFTEESSDGLVSFEVGEPINSFAIGEDESAQNVDNIPRVKDVIILSGYEAADPL